MLLFLFALYGAVTVISPFTTMYESLNKSDLSIGVLILIFANTNFFLIDHKLQSTFQ